jgi:hypothetical protein
MKKLLPIFTLFFAASLSAQVTIKGTTTVKGAVTLAGGTSSGGAPTYVNAVAPAINFSSPATVSVGTVLTGDIIDYQVSTAVNSVTFTMTDNCNTGGASDTNVTDITAANASGAAGTAQKGHFVVGLGRSACTITYAWTGGASAEISALVLRGATAVDVVTATFNPQAGTGTGANIITSTALTTNHADLCVAATVDQNLGGGTLTAGTTIAWTAGASNSTFPNGNEYFIQSGAGAITATFGITVSAYTQTGMTCYH